MRYWRHYPKFLQIILLMLMIFTFMSFAQVILFAAVPSLFGLSLNEVLLNPLKGNHKAIAAFQFSQAVSSIFRFLLGAVFFALLTHPRPWQYLGLRMPAASKNWILAALLFIAAIPLITQTGNWMRLIDFGATAKADFLHSTEKTNALMSGTSIPDLFFYLLLFGVLPAVGEELLFRGIIMRFSYNNSKNIHLAILTSAVLFSLAHSSVYNFLPIMLAGILLGYIYYLSGSIWLSILAHFLNNATAVILLFLGNRKLIPDEMSKMDHFPWYVLILSVAAFIFLFSLLRKNATPLPSDWTDDFKGEPQTIK